MKHPLALIYFCAVLVISAAGQQTHMAKTALPETTSQSQSDANSVEEQIKELERAFAKALSHASAENAAKAVDKYEADDIVTTDAAGRVTDKSQDKAMFGSNDVKYESLTMSDMNVRVYGDVAVVTGTSTGKLTFKGHPYSGTYRATDVWVKRNSNWQLVAQQDTKIEQ